MVTLDGVIIFDDGEVWIDITEYVNRFKKLG